MASVEHWIVIGLAILAILRIFGFFAFIERVWLYREARKSAEKFARYVLNNGSESELRSLIKDHRTMLTDETITLAITRLNDLATEKAQAAKRQEISMRGPAN